MCFFMLHAPPTKYCFTGFHFFLALTDGLTTVYTDREYLEVYNDLFG